MHTGTNYDVTLNISSTELTLAAKGELYIYTKEDIPETMLTGVR